jgi:Putative DNA-binding domain
MSENDESVDAVDSPELDDASAPEPDAAPVSLPTELERLLARLTEAPAVWARMAACLTPNDRQWHLVLLEVISGAPPEPWKERRWEYADAVFAAVEVPGCEVVAWFVASEFQIGAVKVPLKAQYDVHPDRKDSRAPTMYQPLPWPSTMWITQAQAPGGGMYHGQLVADDAPAFLSFDQAAIEFFHLPPGLNNKTHMQQIVFREQDTRARIKQVTVRAADVTVMVDGDDRAGMRVTLGGADGRSQKLDDRIFGVTFGLPDGLAEGAWVALHANQELLDSRVIDPRWRPAPDVEFQIEPAVRLEALISQGENTTFEAKRELPGEDPDRVLKTVAAFANGAGGTIVFGVDNEMQIVGLGDTLNRKSIDRVTSLISDRIHPHIVFNLQQVRIGDEDLLALDVHPGPDVPYGVGTNEQKLTYYVRRSGSSIPARPEDFRAVLRARYTPG